MPEEESPDLTVSPRFTFPSVDVERTRIGTGLAVRSPSGRHCSLASAIPRPQWPPLQHQGLSLPPPPPLFLLFPLSCCRCYKKFTFLAIDTVDCSRVVTLAPGPTRSSLCYRSADWLTKAAVCATISITSNEAHWGGIVAQTRERSTRKVQVFKTDETSGRLNRDCFEFKIKQFRVIHF